MISIIDPWMSDGSEKCPQTKLYWSVSTIIEEVRIG